MNHHSPFERRYLCLRDKLDSYTVDACEWTLKDQEFMERFEAIPFDFHVLQCLNQQPLMRVKGLKESFGHDPRGFSMRKFYMNIHPADAKEVIETDIKLIDFLKDAAGKGLDKTLLTAQFRFADAQGNYHLLNRNSFVIKKDQKGRALCICHFFIDVTESQHFGRVRYSLQYRGRRKELTGSKKDFDVTASLTKREEEVLRLIVKGYSSAEISSELYISKETVYRHRKNMIKKTNSRNTKNLAMRAIAEHWI